MMNDTQSWIKIRRCFEGGQIFCLIFWEVQVGIRKAIALKPSRYNGFLKMLMMERVRHSNR